MRPAFVLALSFALFALSSPRLPEDWDGIGFVASIARFDMAQFAPHPPGYPLYVLALKVAALFTSNAVAAAIAVSNLAAAGAMALLDAAARRTWGAQRAAMVTATLLVTPLVFRSATVIGSEALALTFAALGAWGLSLRRETPSREWAVVGLAVGLGLGVRLSWAPVFLSILILAADRRRAAWLAVASTLAWTVPFAALVGPSALASLYAAHLGGHAARWGGTILTLGAAPRAGFFLRDLVVDGLGTGADVLGVAIAACVLGLSGRALATWKNAGFVHARVAALVVIPYASWIYLGQNLREQPRHVLPLVVLLASLLALSPPAPAQRAPLHRVLSLAVLAALLLVMGARTALDAHARRTVPPAGAQLALHVRTLEKGSPPMMVFGVRSARFFDVIPGSARASVAATLGDVVLSLSRQDTLPQRVFVTSEIEGLATSPYPLVAIATFCRPERLDRREACLSLFELKAPFLAPISTSTPISTP